MVFTYFDTSASTKNRVSFPKLCLYKSCIFTYFSIFQTLSGLFEYVKRVSHIRSFLEKGYVSVLPYPAKPCGVLLAYLLP